MLVDTSMSFSAFIMNFYNRLPFRNLNAVISIAVAFDYDGERINVLANLSWAPFTAALLHISNARLLPTFES